MEDAGGWKQLSKKEEEARQMLKILWNFGDNGRSYETGQRWFQREKTRGGGETENGTGNDEENGGRMVIGQEDM